MLSIVGYIFGFLVLSFGIIIGGICAFFISIQLYYLYSIGRYLLRDCMKDLLLNKYAVFLAIDSTFTEEVIIPIH